MTEPENTTATGDAVMSVAFQFLIDATETYVALRKVAMADLDGEPADVIAALCEEAKECLGSTESSLFDATETFQSFEEGDAE